MFPNISNGYAVLSSTQAASRIPWPAASIKHHHYRWC